MSSTATAAHWNAGLYDDKHAFVWKHGTALVELLAPQPGERILDLGCGTGHLTAQIAAAGAIVTGLDASEPMLIEARSAYPHVTFLHADARDFAFPEPFDAVFSNAVLHWIKEPTAVIRCVARSLKPGGRFVAEFGGKGNVGMIVTALGTAGYRGDPLWYYPSISEYTSLLEAAGLEVRFATLFDRPTPLDGADGLRNWVRMFAGAIVDTIPPARQPDFLAQVEEAARPQLLRNGQWFADYRRLRLVAVRCD